MERMKDLFGQAILDYQNGNYSEDIITSTSISDDDILPISYLFRSYKAMPKLEQKALDLAHGRILDVGCGAGSHSLYLQNKRHLNVKAIDVSKGAIETCKRRGLEQARTQNVLDETETFDTILMLMNGTGIFQELKQVNTYLTHLKTLLKPKGQLLIDSSDIAYMYEDETGAFNFDDTPNYYGELDYFMGYKNDHVALKWLYMDFTLLKDACTSVGLQCELLLEGTHYDYLARITKP